MKCQIEGCDKPIDYKNSQLCRKHYLQTPEQVERVRLYKLKNKIEIADKASLYKDKNREKIAEYNKKYYSDNKDLLSKIDKTYKQNPKSRFKKGLNYAKKRNLKWDILFDQYSLLCSLPCFYCDEKTNNTGTGLDRLNNSLGYSIDNVVPCCRRCNVIRSDILSPAEMLFVARCLTNINLELETNKFNNKIVALKNI